MSDTSSNIALTGPPASGKSRVGKSLAKKLKREFLDTDLELEKQFGCSIREYFEKHSEQLFREAEKVIIAKVCKKTNVVIAIGGGALMSKENRDALESSCLVINLSASLEELVKRQARSNCRPLIKDDKEAALRSLMDKRKNDYDSIEMQIDTTNKTVEQVVEEIILAIAR